MTTPAQQQAVQAATNGIETLHKELDASISSLDDQIVSLQIDMAQVRGKREALAAHRDILNRLLPL